MPATDRNAELLRPLFARAVASFGGGLEPRPRPVSEHLREHLFGQLVYAATGDGCPWCKTWTPDVAVRHRGCAYPEDSSNWLHACLPCWIEDCEHWDEMWEEYRSSVGV